MLWNLQAPSKERNPLELLLFICKTFKFWQYIEIQHYCSAMTTQRVTLHGCRCFYLHHIYKRYKTKPSLSSAQLALLSPSSQDRNPGCSSPNPNAQAGAVACHCSPVTLFCCKSFSEQAGMDSESWAPPGGKEGSNPSPLSIKKQQELGSRRAEGH